MVGDVAALRSATRLNATDRPVSPPGGASLTDPANRRMHPMPVTIDQVIQLIPDWRGRSVTSQPLSGGLTNTNYKVEVHGAPYFL